MSERVVCRAATLMAAADEETAQADDEIVAVQAVTQRHGNSGRLRIRQLIKKKMETPLIWII